jgi:prolyl-tRNA synthetase
MTAITPTRDQDFSQWYQQVVAKSELAEASITRGSMIIKPWACALWELIQHELDDLLKATGHVNAYFPLLIPLHLIEKEAKHIAGFAKECAVVTHHCLKADASGHLIPSGLLEEPYIIRPTSEAIIGTTYANWIQSWRDLPILINQWANVVRWEMRPRLFLRTCEFLWQEGHTAHATKQEAIDEARMILDLYAQFIENFLGMPVIKGEKTKSERFPGAVDTYCVEAMMQDRKALQAGTSHFLGQNFSKAYAIQFTDQQGKLQHAWTTSWGVSTRLIGGLIMTHSDDDGLVLPPSVAPHQIVLLPICRTIEDRSEVLAYCERLKHELSQQHFQNKPLRVWIDDRPIGGGDKNWQWVKKGVPIRIEIGLRELAQDSICFRLRDQIDAKQMIARTQLIQDVVPLLTQFQDRLFQKAQNYRAAKTQTVTNVQEFKEFFETGGGFAVCAAVDDSTIEDQISDLGVTARCIPLAQERKPMRCIFTGEPVNQVIIFAKAY